MVINNKLVSHLNLGFADLKSLCKFLAGESIWVLRFLKGSLQFFDLFRCELGSVPSLIQSYIMATVVGSAATAAAAIGDCWIRQVP